MGLGPYPKIGVKEAYRLAAVAAGLVAQGIDPKADRDAKRAAHALDRTRRSLSRSFGDVAREWLAKHEQEWSRRDYAIDVAQSLHNHVYSVKIGGRCFGDLLVNEIDTATVRAVLDPLWKRPDDGGKPHLADKLRSRIEGVLALAAVQGLRSADNPATWSGHLEEAYPSPSKLAPREHHPAVEPAHAAVFLKALRDIEGHAARALEMLTLSAVRTGSILASRWAHIIDDGQTWWIPNTKTGTAVQPVPQWVPLTQAMVSVLEIQARRVPIDDKAPIFPITASEMYRLCVKLCRQIGIPRAVPHGFRATFKTTSAMRGWDRVLTEAALSHAIGNTVARAYDRREHHRNLLEARKDLMAKWCAFLTEPYLRAVA
jgi:integrase